MKHTGREWDDTIVALATPPGIGAIGVIRLSGPQAITIAATLMPSRALLEKASHTAHVGLLQAGGEVLDEVVVTLFKGPRSYTGENVAEISGHGSPFILEQIIQATIAQGARLAKPGEFTQRAFLNGKMDLTQAESVADMIASNTAASRRTALNSMRGGITHSLMELRVQLIRFSALIELELDFAEEDVAFADRKQFNDLLARLQFATGELLQSFTLGNAVKNGVQVAIIGRPNAGKSTLLNTLLNENRAIVSEVAGTTRDTIEEIINIDGILFRLIDTAGIRTQGNDAVEQIGIERAMEKRRGADVVLYLFDATGFMPVELAEVAAEFKAEKLQWIPVGNKAELVSPETLASFSAVPGIHWISAREQTGINELKHALFAKVISGSVQAESTLVTNTRHYAALQQLSHSLTDLQAGLDHQLTGDLLAADIRNCLHYLGEITGEITNEDMLDYIFSKFCIGK